ncbi:MAG: SPFH domain-containing protein [Gammaproteobacteria bacterium]|nr:SPFH domain-containing protein [Gammaproteobacteria bacterium]
MLMLFLSIMALFGIAYVAKKEPFPRPLLNRSAKIGLLIFAIFGILSRSFLIVGGDEIATLNRIYLGDDLPPGKIIALDGQKGPQAQIIGPGFHLMPIVRIIYDINFHPVQEIPEGHYGLLVTKDGAPLDEGSFIARPWQKGSEVDMLKAEYFLQNGGQKGPQFNVLEPGKYRINPFLYEIKIGKVTDVPTGHVAVIRSNVQSDQSITCPDPSIVESKGGEDVALPLVPKGCVGVWETPYPPGRYYLNQKAFVATIIPTRLQTWNYKGGYTSRKINLTVGDNGKIEQKEEQVSIAVPADAADRAINVRVEGWTIPIDMRVVVAVNPANAAKVVASVGGLKEVEDNIITPAIRDILRTIGGQPDRKVLDFIENRAEIVAAVESAIIPEGLKAGVTIQEVRMGEPAIPPELLVATLREQLATQLKETYEKEREAQRERIKVERERATADQQETLVRAEIEKAAAEHRKEQLRLLGEGEKLKLLEIAKGQEAQALVLGKNAALQLAALEKALEAAIKNDRIVKVPSVQVSGTQPGSFEGAAAILGSSNVIQALKQMGQQPPAK